MSVLRCLPKFGGGNESLAGLCIEKSLSFHLQTTVGRDQSEGLQDKFRAGSPQACFREFPCSGGVWL